MGMTQYLHKMFGFCMVPIFPYQENYVWLVATKVEKWFELDKKGPFKYQTKKSRFQMVVKG